MSKLTYFSAPCKNTGWTGKSLNASIGHMQLELGMGMQFFILNFQQWGSLCTPTWTMHRWEACVAHGITLRAATGVAWIPPLQWAGDEYIMDKASTIYQGQDLQKINLCCITQQVVTLADINMIDGWWIVESYYTGKGGAAISQVSNYNWLIIGTLTQTHLKLWHEFIDKWVGPTINYYAP